MSKPSKEEIRNKIKSFRVFRGKVATPWMKRALSRPDIHTKKNETVKSMSGGVDGKELLYPTIRMRGPGLEKMPVKRAFKEAFKRKDHITFKTPDEATKYSKALSDAIGKKNYVELRFKK